MVALMVQALELKGYEKVLELGTGSGYEAAILAELAGKVVTVEYIPELAKSAKKVLVRLGYSNIEVHVAGRTLGWPEGAPYDAIIVSAGAPSVPEVLLEQLTWNGRLVIPVGSRWHQDLLRVTKLRKGNRIENLGGCYFVPLIGEGAWENEKGNWQRK
jgi:protein-L-isoaspartate(D-aspartate) O-methyltransferase